MQSREQSVICRGPSRRGRDQAGCVDEIAAVRHRGTGACVKEHRVRADRYLACAIYAYIFEEPTMSTVAGTSIYDAIGGEPALVAVVDDFYLRVTGDPELTRFFAGTNMAKLKGRQVEPLTEEQVSQASTVSAPTRAGWRRTSRPGRRPDARMAGHVCLRRAARPREPPGRCGIRLSRSPGTGCR